KKDLELNMRSFVGYFNNGIRENKPVDHLMNTSNFKTTATVRRLYSNGEEIKYDEKYIYTIMYRPFTKKKVYFDSKIVDRRYQQDVLYPESSSENITINFSNKTRGRLFSTLATDNIIDVNLFSGGAQAMPLYLYEDLGGLDLDYDKSGITEEFKIEINEKLDSMDDKTIIQYIYGVLHSPEYIENYQLELNKEFPLIPMSRNYKKFIDIGQRLMNLHLNYEDIEPYKNINIIYNNEKPSYKVLNCKIKLEKY